MDFHPDGSRLAIGSVAGVFLVVDVEAARKGDSEVLATVPLRSGTSSVIRIEYASGGAELITAGLQPELGVWDADTFELKYSITMPVASAGAPLSPSGREVLSSVGEAGTVVYTLDVDRLVGIARERLTRTLTDSECRRFLHLEACPPG
ncbi:hypothetical protein BH23ACT9_BH23ACT9_20310 [soil metagenome]